MGQKLLYSLILLLHKIVLIFPFKPRFQLEVKKKIYFVCLFKIGLINSIIISSAVA